MFGALRLRSATYEDVEHDKSAIRQALIVVVLVSAANFGGELLAGEDTALWWAILRSVIRGVASWAAWALCAWLVVEIAFDVVETDAHWGQLARTTGFAQTPGILNVLVYLSTVGSIIYFAAYAWTFACMVVAVRQSLDYTSTLRAVVVILACLRARIDFEYPGSGANWRYRFYPVPVILVWDARQFDDFVALSIIQLPSGRVPNASKLRGRPRV